MPAEETRMNLLAAVLLALTGGTGLASVHYGSPPPDFAVPTTSGLRDLSQLRGKPIVINFWASWCPPCTNEMPYFERLKQQYGDRVRIVTVDWDEDPALGEAYLRAQHFDLPLISDRQSRIYAAYSLREVPDTVVLDAAGNVTYVSVGGLSWNELDGAVESLLGR